VLGTDPEDVGGATYARAMPRRNPPHASAPAAAPSIARPDVEVRRSARRRRTVSAFREGGRTIVVVPAGMTREEEARWVDRMLARMEAKTARRASDGELDTRARDLSARYLGGRAVPTSVRWVTNQNTRWGSCTVLDGTIRLSHRLQAMPGWVVDYVLLHELVHLLHADHGPAFWAELTSYPHTERARGFLDGVAFARSAMPADEVGGEAGGVDGEAEDVEARGQPDDGSNRRPVPQASRPNRSGGSGPGPRAGNSPEGALF